MARVPENYITWRGKDSVNSECQFDYSEVATKVSARLCYGRINEFTDLAGVIVLLVVREVLDIFRRVDGW